ncbi:hypothetical protein JCM17823_22860 [Halorubrum gandharaense]
MNRRRFLASAAVATAGLAGVAGCLDGGTDPDRPDRPSDALSFSVERVEPFTEDAPAALTLRVENEGDRELTATSTQGPVLPFAERIGTAAGGVERLVCHPDGADDRWLRVDDNELAPTAEVLPESAENGCWRISEAFDGTAVPPGLTGREIAAGAAVEGTYTLYHLHDCIPGTYTFSQAVTLAGAEDGDADGDAAGDPAVEPEEGVPLRLQVAVDEAGGVDVEHFGVAPGYEPPADD